MRISFTGGAMKYMDNNTGYGTAAINILNSFKRLNVECGFHLENPDIEICFNDPWNHYWLDDNSYHIAYSAWESTSLDNKAIESLSKADEIWGTSPWVQSVFQNLFPDKPVFYYKHGIEERFKPKRRTKQHDIFTFLHIGEPYSRKDAQLATECFIDLFGNDSKYRFVMKASRMNNVKILDPYGYRASPTTYYKNIVEINDFLTNEQMLGLYNLCDVFLYPSWGEGFGLQPLEALATGTPVICTEAWADYKKYITFPVYSMLSVNSWPEVHPGLMYKPDRESLKKQMLNAVNNYEDVLKDTFKNSFKIHEEYDWLEVTKPAISRLEEIYKKR